MHLHDLDQVNWIRQKLETPGALELDKDEKRLLLARLVPSHIEKGLALGKVCCLGYMYKGKKPRPTWKRKRKARTDLESMGNQRLRYI
jgi:hypothetical protein